MHVHAQDHHVHVTMPLLLCAQPKPVKIYIQ